MILDREAFRLRAKKIRTDSNMSVRKFCVRIHADPRSYYAYEHGTALPGVESANLICEALNINIQWFLTGEGQKKRYKY
jgi:transcriptional regulator with XRE-family HTH domain